MSSVHVDNVTIWENINITYLNSLYYPTPPPPPPVVVHFPLRRGGIRGRRSAVQDLSSDISWAPFYHPFIKKISIIDLFTFLTSSQTVKCYFLRTVLQCNSWIENKLIYFLTRSLKTSLRRQKFIPSRYVDPCHVKLIPNQVFQVHWCDNKRLTFF